MNIRSSFTRILYRNVVIILFFFSSVAFSSDSKNFSIETQPVSATDYFEKHLIQFLTNVLKPRYPVSENYRLEMSIGKIDNRLKVVPCHPLPHVRYLNKNQIGRPTLSISCQNPSSWSFIVPTTVKVFHPIVIAKQRIDKGQSIDPIHLTLTVMDITSLHQGYFTTPEGLDGFIAKSNIGVNSVISPRSLIKPKVIFKGDKVTLLVHKGSISVRMSGIALGDGREGRQIRVRNKSSARIVKGTVLGPGTVQIQL